MAIDERERPVLELLDEMGIQYRRYEHPCARTMHDCEGIGADIGAQHFKNLFLCNRSGTKFYLMRGQAVQDGGCFKAAWFVAAELLLRCAAYG